jgi:PAS domain S-box-containing protein
MDTEKGAARPPTFEDILAVMAAAAAGDGAARVPFPEGSQDQAARVAAAVNLLLDRLAAHSVEAQAARDRFQKAFWASPAALTITALPEGRWIEVNDALAKMTGYAPEELIGRTSAELGLVDADERAKILQAIREQGRVRDVEIQMRSKTGRIVDTLVSVERIELDGRPCALTIQNDITELKDALREVKRLNLDLERGRTAVEAANKELEAFSYSVAHDLRAPLRSIDGFSKIILDGQGERLDDEGRKHLGYVRDAAQQMARLIDDLLALSRVTRGDMRRRPVDLSAAAREAVGRLVRRNPDRKVEIAIAEGVTGNGDPQLLAVALDNLLGNAWKFTGKRRDARIEFGTVMRDGAAACFVRDNGAGFDMAYAGKLFGVFQRLHAPEEFEGTGIGLATVQRVIRRHGGQVWGEGQVGRGATFFFTLGGEAHD